MKNRFLWPKDYRLRKTKDFQRVQTKGTRWHSSDLIILYRYGDTKRCRIGITASKKVGNAVIRNRIKRKIREGIRKEYFNLIGSWDAVVIAKKSAVTATMQSIQKQISKSFQYISKKHKCSKT